MPAAVVEEPSRHAGRLTGRVAQLPAPPPESSGVGLPEGATPVPDRLVGDGDAALGQEVFHIPEAQAEAKVEPDGVGDDVGGESIAAVTRCVAVHATSLISPPST